MHEAAIVPGKAFFLLFLLYLSRLKPLILIETSEESETESCLDRRQIHDGEKKILTLSEEVEKATRAEGG